MEILLTTKISDLLGSYPDLEQFLIDLNPTYKKLKNPVLRRTVARVATIKQVAFVGGMDPVDLLNRLRVHKGQKPLDLMVEPKEIVEKPDWINSVKTTIDANKLLDDDANPLAEASKALKNLQKSEVLLIVSDFLPSPLIEKFLELNKEIYTEDTNGIFRTYIRS